MDLPGTYTAIVDAGLTWTGLTHPMAHVHAGLAIYIGIQIVLRTRRASSIALQAVYGAEIVNEILNRAYHGSWRIDDTLGDIILTVTWLTLLYAVARMRRARWQDRRVTAGSAAPIPALARAGGRTRRAGQSPERPRAWIQ